MSPDYNDCTCRLQEESQPNTRLRCYQIATVAACPGFLSVCLYVFEPSSILNLIDANRLLVIFVVICVDDSNLSS
jgi:hypothetical protein